MKSKQLLTLAILVTGILGFFTLTAHLNSVRYAHASTSMGCGDSIPFIVTCGFVKPVASSGVPTTSVPFTTTSPYTFVVQISLNGQEFDPLMFYNQPGVTIGSGSETTQGVTGTLDLLNTTAVITAANITLPASRTSLIFRVQVSSTTDVEAVFIVDRAVYFLPVTMRDWCEPEKTDCFEPNNEITQAFVLSPSLQTLTAIVNLTSDRYDFYHVNLPSDLQYTINLSRTTGAGDLDLLVYDHNNVLQCRSSFADNSDETVFVNRLPCSESASSAGKKLPPGVYKVLVRVFSDSTNQNNRYKLRVSQP